MKQILEFDLESAVGRLHHRHFAFSSSIAPAEQSAFPYCGLYVAKSQDSDGFEITMTHSCALEGQADNDDADPTLGAFDRLIYFDDLPMVKINACDFKHFDQRATVQAVQQELISEVIHQFGRFNVYRPGDDDGPIAVRLDCFEYSGTLLINDDMAKGAPLPRNLAGGITTSSFIADGSAKRTYNDLANDLARSAHP